MHIAAYQSLNNCHSQCGQFDSPLRFDFLDIIYLRDFQRNNFIKVDKLLQKSLITKAELLMVAHVLTKLSINSFLSTRDLFEKAVFAD